MTDLKKEIKKLQRYREDIMKWSSNPEVRDKVVLAESRRRIEVEMEKFKAFERESKTKPFSMMGLAMGGRMDAQEQKKHEKRESIEEIVEGLTQESDSIRVEWESLNAKKKKSKSDLTRIDDLKKYSEWHAFHMQSLEQVLRRLDNDLLDPDDLDVLIESLQLYLDQYEQLDYYNDPDMYQQYDLDSDAVDETYYKPSLEESMDTIREPDFIPTSSSGDAPKLREVPLTAAAKARAKKQAAREIEAALSGDPIRPDYPHQHPPKPVRPPMPNIPPPTIPAPSHPPSHPAPIQADFLSSRDGSTLSQHITGASVWGMDNRLKTQSSSLSVNQHVHGLPLMKMLEFSHSNRPRGLDSLHRHAYQPSNSYVQLGNDGRSIYPTKTTRQNDHSLFAQLPFDALQLIFHYREGTPSQFLAAQELKRRHWRFHKKFGIWMQRTGGEVKSSNSTFEYGSYDFFDVGNDNWSIRTKGDFTFDYEFLDDDMVPAGYIDDKLRTICRPVI
jgi:CCR4-NOT transcription complex subunit 3